MRAGGFTIQQALTPDATSIIKQAVTLARRRGHGQVTPLHVAHTMLSASPAGVLRTACLQSHSHPLQCKALELCFNVALNRLPASILATQSATSPSNQYPSISNALVAAFKRAQAHQRRGSVESQQQPLMAVKIELQQLIISILDDPSVSRVMREAGFSSTQVKSNISSTTTSSNNSSSTNSTSEDVMRVIENMMNKKGKNLVIVGESLDTIESVVRGVMRNERLLREVKFVRIALSLVRELSRVERERKLEELKCLVKDEKRVVVYVGDLEWVIENRGGKSCNINRDDDDDPVEEMIDEIRKLANCRDERICILGIACFKTYMKCKNGYPSLQNVWDLHAITIPAAGNLGLSLIPQSDVQSETQSRKSGNGSSWVFDKEGVGYKRLNTNNNIDQESEISVCQKWNSFCSSTRKQTLNFTSLSPDSSTSCFSFDRQNPKNSGRDNNFRPNYPITDKPCDETSLRMYTSSVVLGSPISTPNSASSSEAEYVQRFKEFNAANLKTLCIALEKKVPLHKDIIPEIAGTILQCRSGMLRRREKKTYSTHHDKQETWFVFQGPDFDGAKKKIGLELANAVFGSHSNLISIAASSEFSSDSTKELFSRKKRGRDEKGCGSLMERLGDEMLVNPHRVFFVEDVDEVDYRSQMGIKRAIENGIIVKSSGEVISLSDAIVILNCESLSSKSNEGGKLCENLRLMEKNVDCVSLDLNMCINEGEEEELINDVGLLKCVDRCIIFKLQEL